MRNRFLIFSPTQINSVLGCSSYETADLLTVTDMDLVAFESVETSMTWPGSSGSFVTMSLTLKYKALHKIVVNNWWLTKYTTYVLVDFARMLFMIGKGLHFDLG